MRIYEKDFTEVNQDQCRKAIDHINSAIGCVIELIATTTLTVNTDDDKSFELYRKNADKLLSLISKLRACVQDYLSIEVITQEEENTK